MTSTKIIKETDLVVPIPVIDAGNLANLSDAEFDLKSPKMVEIANKMGDALRDHGFMYLSNHGISEQLVSNAFKACNYFFNLPKEVKNKYAKKTEHTAYNFHGYVGAGVEMLEADDDGVKEWKEMFDFFTIGHILNPTEDAPNFAPTIDKLDNACRHLQLKLLRLLALAVGIEDTDYFVERCKNLLDKSLPSRTIFRTIFYPPIPEDLKKTGQWIGCNEHTDWGLLTLLWQDDVGGLEVKTAQGDWVKATPIPNTIICNTGGLLELWTGGYFPATFHRVHVKPVKRSDVGENGEEIKPRQSLGFFMHPDENVMMHPVRSDIIDRQNSNMKPIRASEYFHKRASQAYGQE